MRIIVDGFGGDNAPLCVLQGAELAMKEYGVDIIVTGSVEKLKKTASENNIDISKMELVEAPLVIPVEADPALVMTDYAESSLTVALKLLAEGRGDAVVCAGSTGAMVMGGSLIVKRIKGVKRATLAPILPSESGCFILMDAGANLECRPEMLAQFAIMGSAYMKKVIGITEPKVGLVNVGAEPTKGREIELATYSLLENSNALNFVGNIEPRYIPRGDVDVVITDGFTGNVILKLTEGLGKMIGHNLKDIFMSGVKSKLAALLVLKKVKAFQKKMDYTEYGGALMMGISKPIIKAHGSSNAKAYKNAIRQARDFVQEKVIDEITESLAVLKSEQKTGEE